MPGLVTAVSALLQAEPTEPRAGSVAQAFTTDGPGARLRPALQTRNTTKAAKRTTGCLALRTLHAILMFKSGLTTPTLLTGLPLYRPPLPDLFFLDFFVLETDLKTDWMMGLKTALMAIFIKKLPLKVSLSFWIRP
ncbi:MAG: hypothetical protein GDA39_10570 [Hyphomonadaceae bacterium]|nr:hypothetical protein [Hyphomonadaceae bacterium]MBC6413264.1 hypothetical protein [Hyphomonadaceae bacterium]